ncbi:MAG: helix-turn-helix domain-containing protein [Kiloniellales bacterium]|nr:helix-turn-helix domain-containing protein [Kiloniellales bacterium]
MDIVVQVGQNLRLLRKQKGLSQEKLGFAAGLDRTYISSIERAKKNLAVRSIAKIAKALDALPARLLAE